MIANVFSKVYEVRNFKIREKRISSFTDSKANTKVHLDSENKAWDIMNNKECETDINNLDCKQIKLRDFILA